MAKAWQFQLPTLIRFGRGTLRKLGDAAQPLGRFALVVGYRAEPALDEAYARAAKSLAAAGLVVTEFRAITGEPDRALIEAGAAVARQYSAELIIGLGGGSVLDAAKAIALVAAGGRLDEHLEVGPRAREATAALPILAVPTTAGTGSEVSEVAVLGVPGANAADPPLKASLFGPALRPRIAVIDPDLAIGTPPPVTAACAADALAHAIEASLSRRANPISSLLAARAVGLIVENLPRALDAPNDPEPREALALAALLAGAAFNESGVTAAHAVAHALGAVLNVPHATAVALATPVNLRYCAPAATAACAELARACGAPPEPEDASAARFVDIVTALLRRAGLPNHVSAPAAPPELFDRLVQSATLSTPVPITLSPRKLDTAALRGMFAEIVRCV